MYNHIINVTFRSTRRYSYHVCAFECASNLANTHLFQLQRTPADRQRQRRVFCGRHQHCRRTISHMSEWRSGKWERYASAVSVIKINEKVINIKNHHVTWCVYGMVWKDIASGGICCNGKSRRYRVPCSGLNKQEVGQINMCVAQQFWWVINQLNRLRMGFRDALHIFTLSLIANVETS